MAFVAQNPAWVVNAIRTKALGLGWHRRGGEIDRLMGHSVESCHKIQTQRTVKMH